MSARHSRLDRLLGKHLNLRRAAVQLLLAQRRIKVDGQVVETRDLVVDGFSVITLDDAIVQAHAPVYLMLHKPVGVLSATKDSTHPVVTDLITHAAVASLHIAGRLDKSASGLLLLTNDGVWSRQLSDPVHGVTKQYEVTLKHPINDDYIAAFAQGMYFGFENITTRPVRLEIIGEHKAKVTLQEGRYHQIKRMFGRFRNPVLAIHRTAIGEWQLDASLKPGEWKELSKPLLGPN